jgi:arylsulfatase A-like enzyme
MMHRILPDIVKRAAAVAFAALAPAVAMAAPEQRPNIIIFYTDDQPQIALGSKSAFFHTPNMDRLAREGVVFTESFVTTSVCCVSRASFLTGQMMSRHGVASFNTPLSRNQMDASFPVLLRNAGYRTAYLGKFGIGHTRAADRSLCLPEDRFDLWYGFLQGPSYHQKVDGKKRYLTSVMEEKALAFIGEQAGKHPFLVVMALPEPHGQAGPWNYRDPDFSPPPPSAPPPRPATMNNESFERLPEAVRTSRNRVGDFGSDDGFRTYMETVRAYVARADHAVGNILRAVEELGIADNTVVIFTSDNGSMWGAHGLAGKWNMYEESIRVPLVIRDPRIGAGGRGTRSQVVLNIDLAPTILEMAGLTPPARMQGQSLVTALRNPATPSRKDWFYEHDVATESKGPPLPRCEGVRSDRWKYIRYKDTTPVQEELIDIPSDPRDEHNLAGNPEFAPVLDEMRVRLAELAHSAK